MHSRSLSGLVILSSGIGLAMSACGAPAEESETGGSAVAARKTPFTVLRVALDLAQGQPLHYQGKTKTGHHCEAYIERLVDGIQVTLEGAGRVAIPASGRVSRDLPDEWTKDEPTDGWVCSDYCVQLKYGWFGARDRTSLSEISFWGNVDEQHSDYGVKYFKTVARQAAVCTGLGLIDSDPNVFPSVPAGAADAGAGGAGAQATP